MEFMNQRQHIHWRVERESVKREKKLRKAQLTHANVGSEKGDTAFFLFTFLPFSHFFIYA